MIKLAVLSMLCLLAIPLQAGVVYEIEVTNHEQSPPKSESIKTAVQGKNLKIGITQGGGNSKGVMIFRGERREMVVVDHGSKSYFVMDRKQMKEISGQMSNAMAKMQEALKNVPEDKRAMVEQMMKNRMPQAKPRRTPTELRKTGKRQDMNGYPCVKYEVLRDGRKIRELWVTDWKNVEGSDDVVGAFKEMSAFVRTMTDTFSSKSEVPGGMDDSIFTHMEELDGFPVVTRDFGDDGSLEGESSLRSAKRQTIDPDAFDPPSGYKRQEMFRGRP